MSSRGLSRAAIRKAKDYATPEEFGRIFHDDSSRLYTLALLLTADHNAAEQCFVAGLADCINATRVFAHSGETWARRTIIKNAIRMVSPASCEAASAATAETGDQAKSRSEAAILEAAIVQLPPLERFVYVMSVLERYSNCECSTLLHRSITEVVDARSRALQRVAAVSKNESMEQSPLLKLGRDQPTQEADTGSGDVSSRCRKEGSC